MKWREEDERADYFDKSVIADPMPHRYLIIRAKHDAMWYITPLDIGGHHEDIGPFANLESAKVYYRLMK